MRSHSTCSVQSGQSWPHHLWKPVQSGSPQSQVHCPSLSRNWWSHCSWNWTAIRSLACTAEDWLATPSSLWISWNWCMKMWALTVPGYTCSLMRNCQRKLGANWQLLMEKLALPRSMWRSLGLPVGSEEVTVATTGHWDWVYPRDLWGNCFWTLLCWLMHWSLGSRFTEDAHLHTAPRLIDTVQLITDCVFHWLASIIDHCMHVQVCDTDSLNQCQGEVLRYMHCTHTTAHIQWYWYCQAYSLLGSSWAQGPGSSHWQKGWLSLHWFDLNCSLLVVLEKDPRSFQFVCLFV